MKVERTFLVFLAGCAAYASLAACSGGSDTQSGPGSTGTSMSTSSAPGGGTNAGGHGGAGGAGAGHATGGGSATGGGGTGGGAGGGGNGLRLKRYFHGGADGSRDDDVAYTPYWESLVNAIYGRPEASWYDSLRDEDCVYRPAVDGKLRCLPTGPTGAWSAYASIAGQCVRVAAVQKNPSCPPHPKYFFQDTPPMCPITRGTDPVRVFELGAKVNLMGCVYDDDQCMHADCSVDPWVFYEVGAEVPAGAFVAGTPAHDP